MHRQVHRWYAFGKRVAKPLYVCKFPAGAISSRGFLWGYTDKYIGDALLKKSDKTLYALQVPCGAIFIRGIYLGMHRQVHRWYAFGKSRQKLFTPCKFLAGLFSSGGFISGYTDKYIGDALLEKEWQNLFTPCVFLAGLFSSGGFLSGCTDKYIGDAFLERATKTFVCLRFSCGAIFIRGFLSGCADRLRGLFRIEYF